METEKRFAIIISLFTAILVLIISIMQSDNLRQSSIKLIAVIIIFYFIGMAAYKVYIRILSSHTIQEENNAIQGVGQDSKENDEIE